MSLNLSPKVIDRLLPELGAGGDKEGRLRLALGKLRRFPNNPNVMARARAAFLALPKSRQGELRCIPGLEG